MAHTLTESPTFAPTVTVPDDGDDLEAASVEVGLQAIADRTQALKAGTVGLDNATVIGDLEVGANADVTGTLTVDDQSTFNGQAFFNANATFNQNAIFNDPAAFTDAATFDGIFSVTYDAGVGGNLSVALTATVGTLRAGFIDVPIALTSTGRILQRAPQFGANFNTFYGPVVTSLVIATSLTVPRTYTISDSGASNGDVMTFVNETNHVLSIHAPGGTPLIDLEADATGPGGSGTWQWCDVMRVGGAWRVIRKGF